MYDLATALPRAQFSATVAFGGTGSADAPAGTLLGKLELANIRTIHIPKLGRDIAVLSDIRAFIAIYKLLRKEQPDVLHLNSSKAAGLGALAGRLARIRRIVFTVHGWPFLEQRSNLARTAIRFFSWCTVALSHQTICISKNDMRALQQVPVIRNKLTLIRNGIAPFEPVDRKHARDELARITGERFSPTVPLIGTIAELHPNKGLDDAIRVCARLRKRRVSFRYIIIGAGESEQRLRALIHTLELDRYVFLAGFVEHAARYLAAFDVFFLPSHKEGIPYALLEAGMAGLPVVATPVGGIPEIITHGETGALVSVGDIESMSRDIRLLLDDSSHRRRLGAALHLRIEETSLLHNMVDATAHLYVPPTLEHY